VVGAQVVAAGGTLRMLSIASPSLEDQPLQEFVVHPEQRQSSTNFS
jgi:hypothetical protein